MTMTPNGTLISASRWWLEHEEQPQQLAARLLAGKDIPRLCGAGVGRHGLRPTGQHGGCDAGAGPGHP